MIPLLQKGALYMSSVSLYLRHVVPVAYTLAMLFVAVVHFLRFSLRLLIAALVPLNVQTRIREQFFWTSRLARVMLLLSRTFLSPGGDHDLNPPTLPLL